MRSRASATALLAASLGLLAVVAILWPTAGPRGVGLEVPPGSGLEDATGVREGSARLTGPPTATGEDAATSGEAGTLASGAAPVPVRDAGVIAAQEPVTPPARLHIPRLGVHMPIAATGVLEDGQMQLPDDPDEIGWYRFGALPGDPRGSAVLGGHVDSRRYGVGPLARLAAVRNGDSIAVSTPDGTTVRYRVTSVERISKAGLPTEELFDPDSRPRLVVITCGGRYLPEAGGYEDNVVVIARPI